MPEYAWNGTANAVWVYAHPGFKSPILRHLTRGFAESKIFGGAPVVFEMPLLCVLDSTWCAQGVERVPSLTGDAGRWFLRMCLPCVLMRVWAGP